MSDEEDSIQINTINQNEYQILLAKKKQKLNESKTKIIGKSDQQKLEKNKKLIKKNEKRDDEKIQVTEGLKPKEFKFRRDDKAETNTNFHSKSGGTKSAKFSSLFKNNHEIPNVGDIEAKNQVKESVFSSNPFSNLNLSAHVVDCLTKRFKLEKMTMIQEKSIPAILSGRDCFVKSQTGSGKTLAYAIPIIQHLQSLQPKLKRTDGIKALVLVPTRELAIQTCQVFEQLCNACVWIVPGALIGGMKKKSEKDRIRRGLNVLIATPGRLCDHLDTTMALDLSKLDYLIFDEADRMLDMDFEKKINFIIFKIHSAKKKALAEPEIPKFKLDENGEPIEDPNADKSSGSRSNRIDPQTILISATLTNGIKEIARRLNIDDALHIDAAATDTENFIKNDNGNGVSQKNKIDHELVEKEEEEEQEKIALPTGLTHYYMITPSKLRLIGLISFIMDKFIYQLKMKASKLIIFASTNDSVQFHEKILNTFLNRKFNMYLDDEEIGNYDEFDSDLDDQLKASKKNNTSSLIESKNNNSVCDLFSLYGNMDQHRRAEILAKFCKAQSGVLICTDVAARGLDMPNIDWIIQYNTPGSCVDYVHRVGRTARVGHKGKALIFLEPCEVEYLKELNKLGISLREIKLESVMDCLNDEAKHYPRQVNSDRLVFAKNAEECANSMQFYIEEYVEKSNDVQVLARKAYLSFMRAYSCYSGEMKKIFHLKNLHIGHVAKSFGLREAPKDIKSNDMRSIKSGDYFDNKKKKTMLNDYDPLDTKYKRDLKRISNGHKEYGNVIKKNKLKSQKANLDLSGLLKNYSTVSEYDSGMNNSNQKVNNNRKAFKRPFSTTTSHNNNNNNSSTSLKKPIKIIKKNMDIFD